MKTKPNLKKLLESTKRTLYIDNAVLATAPSKIEGVFELFTVGKYISNGELEKEYEKRGLVPADIETIVEHEDINKDHQWVATHWKDTDGKWCYATFNRWLGDGRSVLVVRDDCGWGDDWFFGGVRKDFSSSDTKPSLESLDLELPKEYTTYVTIKGIKYKMVLYEEK